MNFRCHLSGACCHDLQVSTQEFEEMKAAGPMLNPLDLTEYDDGMKVINVVCPWLDRETKLCTIYTSRPGTCRQYLCFRGAPDDAFRSYEEQVEFFKTNQAASKQAKEMRQHAIEYSKQHGWPSRITNE